MIIIYCSHNCSYMTGDNLSFFCLLRWWRKIFHSIWPTTHDSLTNTGRTGILLSPLSASLRTGGCRCGAAQTSDGLLINPCDGQSRPDEYSVQNSWVNHDHIHLLFREGQGVPQCSSLHKLMCVLMSIIKVPVLQIWVCRWLSFLVSQMFVNIGFTPKHKMVQLSKATIVLFWGNLWGFYGLHFRFFFFLQTHWWPRCWQRAE